MHLSGLPFNLDPGIQIPMGGHVNVSIYNYDLTTHYVRVGLVYRT